MRATDLLRQEHDAVRALFVRYADASARERPALVHAIRDELALHTRAEEEVFYPAVRRVRSGTTRDTVKEALEEHHHVDGLLAELDETESEDPRFEERFGELRRRVLAHLADEEARLFAEAHHHLSEDRLERLGAQIAAFRQRVAVTTRG
jgi:hemerythrin superfamily protein